MDASHKLWREALYGRYKNTVVYTRWVFPPAWYKSYLLVSSPNYFIVLLRLRFPQLAVFSHDLVHGLNVWLYKFEENGEEGIGNELNS